MPADAAPPTGRRAIRRAPSCNEAADDDEHGSGDREDDADRACGQAVRLQLEGSEQVDRALRKAGERHCHDTAEDEGVARERPQRRRQRLPRVPEAPAGACQQEPDEDGERDSAEDVEGGAEADPISKEARRGRRDEPPDTRDRHHGAERGGSAIVRDGVGKPGRACAQDCSPSDAEHATGREERRVAVRGALPERGHRQQAGRRDGDRARADAVSEQSRRHGDGDDRQPADGEESARLDLREVETVGEARRQGHHRRELHGHGEDQGIDEPDRTEPRVETAAPHGYGTSTVSSPKAGSSTHVPRPVRHMRTTHPIGEVGPGSRPCRLPGARSM